MIQNSSILSEQNLKIDQQKENYKPNSLDINNKIEINDNDLDENNLSDEDFCSLYNFPTGNSPEK